MSDSVINATGQMWKFVVAVAALLIGSVAPLWAASGISMTTGTVLAIVGYAFACLAIRCPGCGNRWFLSALTRADWYKPLLTKPVCPACEQGFSAN